MYIKNSYIAFIYRITVLIICGVSIMTHFGANMEINSRMLSYFTVQSSIFCFIIFLILSVSTYNEIKYKNIPFFRYSYSSLKGMATLSIIITFLSYQVLLRNSGFSMYANMSIYSIIKDVLVHFIVPILVILDWLLFQPKGLYRWFDTLIWLLFPFAYFMMIVLRGQYIHQYPYFFLNIQEIGLYQVLIFVCIYITIILIIGFIFFSIDKLLSAFSYRIRSGKI